MGGTAVDQKIVDLVIKFASNPAPQRKRQTTWESMLKAHWNSVAANGFTTTDVWTLRGLVTTFIFVVMNLKTRRIELAGVTAHPDVSSGQRVTQNSGRI